MKLIFLDIDGVLNNIYSKKLLCDEPMNNLAKIVANTNAKIVMISSWAPLWIYKDKFNTNRHQEIRTLFESKLIKALSNNNIKYNIEELGFINYNKDFNQTVPTIDLLELSKESIPFEKSRQNKINNYIKANYSNEENVNYVVIDDYEDFYDKDKHIKTSYYEQNKMLSNSDIEKATIILNENRQLKRC